MVKETRNNWLKAAVTVLLIVTGMLSMTIGATAQTQVKPKDIPQTQEQIDPQSSKDTPKANAGGVQDTLLQKSKGFTRNQR